MYRRSSLEHTLFCLLHFGMSTKVIWCPFWTLKRKIHLMWILRRNLPAEVDYSWSTEGLHFVNNKSLVLICSQGLFHILCVPGRFSDWTLSFPHSASLSLLYLWINHYREALGLYFYQGTETCLVQLELRNWGASFT